MENLNQTLVTIAIPAYKSKHLAQAIESALRQTYARIELVIVNDKSPEDIASIVNKFDDRRIRYFENERNLGGDDPAENWNKCLSYAQGEYFCLLCDDDYYDPQFVEEMMSLAILHPSVSVFRSRVKFVNERNDIIDLFPSSPDFETAMDYLWSKVARYRIQTISEFMLKTRTVKEKGGYTNMPKAWCADEISICKFAKERGICHSNKLLVSFRMSGENISSNEKKNIEEKVYAQSIYTDWICEFIAGQEAWFQQSLMKHRQRSLDISIPSYLQYATIFQLYRFCINKKKYHISTKQLVKALYLKMSFFLIKKNCL